MLPSDVYCRRCGDWIKTKLTDDGKPRHDEFHSSLEDCIAHLSERITALVAENASLREWLKPLRDAFDELPNVQSHPVGTSKPEYVTPHTYRMAPTMTLVEELGKACYCDETESGGKCLRCRAADEMRKGGGARHPETYREHGRQEAGGKKQEQEDQLAFPPPRKTTTQKRGHGNGGDDRQDYDPRNQITRVS